MKGIILVNKDFNKTSRDMVNELNHIFTMKRIGHTGTLDPIATGVLVMCLGTYTKLVDKLSALEKEYIAEIKLGIKTDTLDITGNVLEEMPCHVTKDEVEKVLESLKGTFRQVVPIYSAKKINGKKLYEYAREGKEVELPVNEVEIFDIQLLDMHDDIIKFKTLVSKGTYIRSLIEEITKRLNVLGTMNSLIRTKQGKYSIEDSYTINDIKNDNYKILDARSALGYEEIKLNDNEYFKVKNGNKIKFNTTSEYVICTYENEEIAIYKKEEDLYRIDIMLM